MKLDTDTKLHNPGRATLVYFYINKTGDGYE